MIALLVGLAVALAALTSNLDRGWAVFVRTSYMGLVTLSVIAFGLAAPYRDERIPLGNVFAVGIAVGLGVSLIFFLTAHFCAPHES